MYWPDEVDALMGFWETVDRRNDRTRIYMAANAADSVNPYFTEWDLTLPTKGKTKTYPHNESSITIQYADDAEFRKYASRTNIGKFTAGTNYARYAQDNEFLADTEALIGTKTSASLFRCELGFNRKTTESGSTCRKATGTSTARSQRTTDANHTPCYVATSNRTLSSWKEPALSSRPSNEESDKAMFSSTTSHVVKAS